MATISHFECVSCVRRTPSDEAPGACPHCEGPLLARYDMEALRAVARRPPVHPAPDHSLLRYRAVLPAFEPIWLAEADTPMLPSRTARNLWLKLENRSACGTGLIRGLGLAAEWHKRMGYTRLAIACEGAEAVALAACGAAVGVESIVFLPEATDFDTQVRCAAFGATVQLVAGGVMACEAELRQAGESVRDLSDAAHPLRIEGDKTAGYEIAEHLGWTVPDAIVCSPESVLALRKAFAELEELGWLEHAAQMGAMPKLYVATVPERAELQPWIHAASQASGGGIYTPSAQEHAQVMAEWAASEGFLLSPEGAAALACYRSLLKAGDLTEKHRCVLIDNGEVEASIPLLAGTLGLERPRRLPGRMPVGGIITPQ